MGKKLVKLWMFWKPFKATLRRCYYDFENNIYYECPTGLYKVDPYTGEVELTDLPIITEVEEKNVKILREGSTYSIKVEDVITGEMLRDGTISCTRNAVYYKIRKDMEDYLKIYDIESGEKVYELKGDNIYPRFPKNSRYLLIETISNDGRRGKIVIFDFKRKEIRQVDETLGILTSKTLPYNYPHPSKLLSELLLDLGGIVYSKYGKVKLLICLRDKLLEYEYDTPVYITEDSFHFIGEGETYEKLPGVECIYSKGQILLVTFLQEVRGLDRLTGHYNFYGGEVDFALLNLDRKIEYRWITSANEFFINFLEIYKKSLSSRYPPYVLLLDFFDKYDDTIIFSAGNRIVAFRSKNPCKRSFLLGKKRKWIRIFPYNPYYYNDLMLHSCLVFNYKNCEGTVINFQDAKEIYLGTLPDWPIAFYNGIIIFRNGAYGVKGIFENSYVRMLEKLINHEVN